MRLISLFESVRALLQQDLRTYLSGGMLSGARRCLPCAVEARRSASCQNAPFDFALPNTGKTPLRVLASDESGRVIPVRLGRCGPGPVSGLILRAVPSSDAWGGRSTRPTSSRRPEYDEQALIAAAQGGHLPAFNQIILHYQGLAYNVAYRIVGDTDAAADATQDGFVKAFQRIGQYRGGSFKAWLLRIITNTCYDALRARRRRPTVSLEREVEGEDADSDYDPRLIDHAERPDAYVMRKELAGLIQQAIGQLPEDQRTALILSDIEGLDYQEIADTMGTALGTVKSRLSRARAKMRDILVANRELLPAQYRLTDG